MAQSRNLGSVFDESPSCFRVSFASRSLEFFLADGPRSLGFVVSFFSFHGGLQESNFSDFMGGTEIVD